MLSRLGELIAATGEAGRPLLIVLAGSNGAGKSTFHAEALSGIGYPSINADEIARDLAIWSGRAASDLAYEAMRRADELRNDLVEQRVRVMAPGECLDIGKDGLRLVAEQGRPVAGQPVLEVFVLAGGEPLHHVQQQVTSYRVFPQTEDEISVIRTEYSWSTHLIDARATRQPPSSRGSSRIRRPRCAGRPALQA